jgi:hypothetical protein
MLTTLQQQSTITQVQNTTSNFAANKQFAAIHAANYNKKHAQKLTAQQLQNINALYALVCNAYNCTVYKNTRKNICSIKVLNARFVNMQQYLQLLQYCAANNIAQQNNVNTASVSYIITY